MQYGRDTFHNRSESSNFRLVADASQVLEEYGLGIYTWQYGCWLMGSRPWAPITRSSTGSNLRKGMGQVEKI